MKVVQMMKEAFWLTPRSRYAGNGFKSPQAAWVKSPGSER